MFTNPYYFSLLNNSHEHSYPLSPLLGGATIQKWQFQKNAPHYPQSDRRGVECSPTPIIFSSSTFFNQILFSYLHYSGEFLYKYTQFYVISHIITSTTPKVPGEGWNVWQTSIIFSSHTFLSNTHILFSQPLGVLSYKISRIHVNIHSNHPYDPQSARTR